METDKGRYRVPFDRGHLEFTLPEGMKGTAVMSRPVEPFADIREAVAAALARPVGSRPIRERVGPGDRVCIAFTDVTRASPDHCLVPPILAELESAGVRRDRVTLLCAVGMHRPSTPAEKEAKLGREVVARYRVVDHDPGDPDFLTDLGTTRDGVPMSVNRLACEADFLIATGVVEPHQYAGYSGGGKTVAIGTGGESLIAHTHGPAMVDHPGTRLGKVAGNPFREIVREAADRAGLDFIINVVQDEVKQPVAVYAGAPEAAFQKLVSAAREIYETPIPHQYDVAVAGVGYPKDLNLYQASRAVSYLFFAPTCVVKKGGVFILPAPTPEGVGEGRGEQQFLEKMNGAGDTATLLEELRRTGYPPGAQRAFIMAKVLEETRVVVVGSRTPDVVAALKMIPEPDMDHAFRTASRIVGRGDLEVLVVPHALLTLPIVRP